MSTAVMIACIVALMFFLLALILIFLIWLMEPDDLFPHVSAIIVILSVCVGFSVSAVSMAYYQ